MSVLEFIFWTVTVLAFIFLCALSYYYDHKEKLQDKRIKKTVEEQMASDIDLMQKQIECIQFDLAEVKGLLTERGMLFKQINDNVETLNTLLAEKKEK